MKMLNDNTHPMENITERDIHAYVDGRLDGARRRRVEAYLETAPDVAQEVRDYIALNELLRDAYEPVADEPVPLRLLAALNRRPGRILPGVLKAAAVVILCLVSAVAGWLSGQVKAPNHPETAMLNRFLSYVASSSSPRYGGASLEPVSQTPVVNLAPLPQADPLNWLTQKVALEMQAPDLAAAGYALEERELVQDDTHEFVRLTYRGQDDRRLRLYMKTRWEPQPPQIRFVSEHERAIAYWQEGPLVYALTGVMDEVGARRVAELVRESMSTIPDATHHVQDVDIKTAPRGAGGGAAGSAHGNEGAKQVSAPKGMPILLPNGPSPADSAPVPAEKKPGLWQQEH